MTDEIDYLGIIDKIHDILSNDGAISSVNGLNTVFVKYLNSNQYNKKLLTDINLDDTEFKLYEDPLVCISTGNIDFKGDVPTVVIHDQINLKCLIDVVYSDKDFLTARTEALKLIEKIRVKILKNKSLDGLVYELKATSIQDGDEIKIDPYMYHYGFRLNLLITLR